MVKVRTAALRLIVAMAMTSLSTLAIAQVTAANSVSSFYDRFQPRPIWFHNGVADPAASQLVGILRRAPFDGLATGAALAAGVEATLARAQTGNPADVTAADRRRAAAGGGEGRR